MAVAFDVKMAHHEEPHIAGHLLASIPHGTFVECFHPDRDPIFWNLLSNRAPLVLCLHSDFYGLQPWDDDEEQARAQEMQDALSRFADYALSHEAVRAVRPMDLIGWMLDPRPLAEVPVLP